MKEEQLIAEPLVSKRVIRRIGVMLVVCIIALIHVVSIATATTQSIPVNSLELTMITNLFKFFGTIIVALFAIINGLLTYIFLTAIKGINKNIVRLYDSVNEIKEKYMSITEHDRICDK